MKPDLVVLAAGMGSRYGGLKQLDGVGGHGERLLDYSLYDALRAGFGRVVFVIRRDFEASFRASVLPAIADRIDATCVCQELDDLPSGEHGTVGRTKPWGTGHAILCCRRAVRGPFAVINADDFYGADAYVHLAGFLQTSSLSTCSFALVGYRLARTLSDHGAVSRGVCDVSDSGALRGVEEWTGIRAEGGVIRGLRRGEVVSLSSDTTVSMNLWGFTPALFDPLERAFRTFLRERGGDPASEFFIPTVVDNMLQAGTATVRVLSTAARWMGLTYADDRDAVRRGIAALTGEGVYPSPLWAKDKGTAGYADEYDEEADRPLHRESHQPQEP